MATTTSKLHLLKVAIVDGLLLRANIISGDVQVASAWLGDETRRESIQLDDTDMNQEWSALGNKQREESLDIHGIIWVQSPGAGEATIRVARARAVALQAEVEDFLRLDPSVGGLLVRGCQIRPVLCEEGAGPLGRWCQISFRIHAEIRLQST